MVKTDEFFHLFFIIVKYQDKECLFLFNYEYKQVSNFADFATIQGVLRADGNKKGIFTLDRRPKFGAHYLRDRWLTIPDFGHKSGKQIRI